MDTRFMPGPWKVVGARDPQRGQRIAGAIGDESFTVCYAETPLHGGNPRHDMRDGNAHLIAAAPELYETLDHIAGEANGPHPDPEAVFRNILDAARAALAKARGEQP
jgi:hypothetical protein